MKWELKTKNQNSFIVIQNEYKLSDFNILQN